MVRVIKNVLLFAFGITIGIIIGWIKAPDIECLANWNSEIFYEGYTSGYRQGYNDKAANKPMTFRPAYIKEGR